ncbi:SET domain-containing protein [Halalkalibacter urbisdiaboli]|uniref:SET domain-containing protein n=1 Tax=Halalkalibacter urbisdiaboli TaxID=1960589 RepID=UPI001055C585|nr:SET domain-containing protein [Halalkalibacter urbisdiaboli]
MIEIKTSSVSKGEFNRGVFASQDIKEGELIHVAPAVPYPNEQDQFIEQTDLADYVYEYGINHSAVILGYGMLFNHSHQPNATYEIDFDKHVFNYYAYKDIKAGEEIFINYNGDVDDNEPLWFEKE